LNASSPARHQPNFLAYPGAASFQRSALLSAEVNIQKEFAAILRRSAPPAGPDDIAPAWRHMPADLLEYAARDIKPAHRGYRLFDLGEALPLIRARW
jgi:hypothetical protein